MNYSDDLLRRALGNYGTYVRDFGELALMSNNGYSLPLLKQLGDEEKLADAGYRLELAGALVRTVMFYVATIPDPTKKQVAEAVLATKKPYIGKTVIQRKGTLLDSHGIGIDVYNSRKAQVLAELTAVLIREFHGWSKPLHRLCIAGDSVAVEHRVLADAFGRGLADDPVRIVSGYAAAGLRISEALVARLKEQGKLVESDRIVQYARSVRDRMSPAGEGTLIRHGQTQEQKRHRMLLDCAVLVLFEGGPGTEREALIAEGYGIPVLPLPSTGGTARSHWQKSLEAGRLPIFGGHEVDPTLYAVLLADEDPEVSVAAALALVRQAITGAPADPRVVIQGRWRHRSRA